LKVASLALAVPAKARSSIARGEQSLKLVNIPSAVAAILAYGAGGLGAVKKALPAAEYGHIKLVAALMNSQVRFCLAFLQEADGGACDAIEHAAQSLKYYLDCCCLS
jgi:hypothetical protein